MFIEVNKIPPEGLEVDRALELPPAAADPEAPVPEEVRLAGTFERSLRDVVFKGKVEAVVSLICSRCLAAFTVPVAGSCHRVYRAGFPQRSTSDRKVEELDLALTPFDGLRIDLREIAQEQIYLMIPLKPLCGERCQGLCQSCGVNRNLNPCGCPDPRQGIEPLTLKIPL